jgi:hypothetical protein
MKSFNLAFSYKGVRHYIHGSDMLNKCAELLRHQFPGNLQHFSFAIHRMTSSNLVLQLQEIVDCEPKIQESDIASLRFEASGQTWIGRLVETGERPTERISYDEEKVLRLCVIEQNSRSIALHLNSPYTAFETIISMTKALHLNAYPNMTAQWTFCRWESLHWPLVGCLKGVNICLVQTLGTRLTKSAVILNGENLGHIYFSARNNK